MIQKISNLNHITETKLSSQYFLQDSVKCSPSGMHFTTFAFEINRRTLTNIFSTYEAMNWKI